MINVSDIKVDFKTNGVTVGELGHDDPRFRYLKPGTIVVLADGVGELMDMVGEKMSTPKQDGDSDANYGGDFWTFKSFKEAVNIFRNKPESVVKYDPAELSIRDNDESGTQVEYDVTGDFIDMGRFMEGIPEAVGTMRAGNARNRRVNFVINLNQWANVKAKDVIHRGERILRLVDALEAGGVRCQLTGIDSNECAHIEVVIKQHQEPLTITDLAVALHTDFKRRIVFRIDEYSKTWDYGYGSPFVFSQALTPEVLYGGNNNELDIMIGSSLQGVEYIDGLFDKLERLLVWEMNKPVPEVESIKLDKEGIYFSPNGYRAEADIRREGLEAIRGD